jgi:hypothetical protein
LKIENFSNYPDEVKSYVDEYNNGVDHKDINLVGTAINSLVQLLFSAEELNRQAATHVLDQVATVQPGFLKSAVKTLLIRFQGSDEAKKNYAAAALEAIFIGKKAEKLIDDPTAIEQLRNAKNQREQQAIAVKQQEAQIVQQIKSTQMDLTFLNAFPELRTLGQFYNTTLLNNQDDQGFQTATSLLNSLMEWHAKDRSKFMPGCLLLGLVFSPQFRRPYIANLRDELLKLYYQGNTSQKIFAAEVMENVLREIVDILPPDIAGFIQGEVLKKQQERQAQKSKELEQSMMINKLKVPINVAWEQSIQAIANSYNEGIATNKEKLYKQALNDLYKLITSNNERERKNSIEVVGILLVKNPELLKDLVLALLEKYTQPLIMEALGYWLDDLAKLRLAHPTILDQIAAAKNIRLQEEESKRKERQAEYDRIKKLTIQIDGDWPKEIVKTIEMLNDALLTQNEKIALKIVSSELKKLMFAKDLEIRRVGQTIFARIAEKYPGLLEEVMKELVPLYLSEHEQRALALDPFGLIYDMGFGERFFLDKYPDVWKILPTDWANRKQEMENLELQTKFDAIKADVTQIRIREDWVKNIQRICRDYNNAIKAKLTDEIFKAVKEIVDLVLNEKKQEIQNQANQVLGLIAKRNIELIQPTIDLFLQMIDGKDSDKKDRAIRGLGEVTRQRPGWAYFGIEKLVKITQIDPDDEFRMKAMLEISLIGEKDPVMLIEYVDDIVKALAKDSNKQVRRIAAMALGNMAEAIPLEAQQAIPALTDALHDEYMLVRKFADKALGLIREAIRKAENQ